MNHKIMMFLKFGNESNIYDLYENGTIYMNPIQHFRTIEDAELRGDKLEGVSRIINSLPGSFRIESINHTVNYQSIHLTNSYKKVLGNLYCLFCVSSHGWENPMDFTIDKRNKDFGTHCLMIKNNRKFLNLMETSLKNEGYKYRHGFVEYYDRLKINGDINLFQKPLEYEYQKEFRFYVINNKIKPIVLKLGSLKDISEVTTIDEILHLKLEYKTSDLAS